MEQNKERPMSTSIENSPKINKISKPEARVIRERCVGCQECVIRCPTLALSIDVVNWEAKADNELCVGCRQCERTCPFSAITIVGPLKLAPRASAPQVQLPVKPGSIAETRPGLASMEDAVKEAERCLNCPDPTCVLGCPAHNDIPSFIQAIRENDLERAQRVLAETTCLPDVCSRVCDVASQCEGSCSWALAGGEPVAIGKLERFVTDHSPVPPIQIISDRGKELSVGILGSGPAGIAAAWELAGTGVKVVIYEREAAAGGILKWGIPSYVLPDKVSQRPVQALQEAGVEIQTNTNITPEMMDRLLTKHDAVIVAFGAPVPEIPELPGIKLNGVMNATEFLTKAKTALANGTPQPEFRGTTVPVLVLGGSDTAIDVARSVLRLGGKPIIIHRREEKFSRARADQIIEAENEGVQFRFATNLVKFEGENGKLTKAVIAKTYQKRPGTSPDIVKGTEQAIDTDMVVLATGYKLEPRFAKLFKLPVRPPIQDRLLPDRHWIASGIFSRGNAVGNVAWEREYSLLVSLLPQRERLWLAGDALVGPSTVVGSMAQGRLAARALLDSNIGHRTR
jgi:glutamate synthase (NADPH/NADH) small chain